MKNISLPALIFVFLFPILIGFSSLSTPFTLIGDPQIIKTSQFPYVISGPNPVSFHLYHLLIYSFSSVIIFLIIHALTKSSLSGIIASFGYLFTTASSENWNKLGSLTPLAVLFLLLGIYCLIKLYHITQNSPFSKKSFLFFLITPILSLSLAIFTKEANLAVIPPLIFLIIFPALIFKKFNLYCQTLTIITLLTVASVLFSVLKHPLLINFRQADLLKNFNFCANTITRDAGLFLPLSLLFFLIILIKKSRDLRRTSSMFKVFCFFFLALSASFLVIQDCPTALMPLFLFIGCSLSYFLSLTRRLKKATMGRLKVLGHLFSLIFILYALIFFYFQIKEVAKEIFASHEKAILHSDMVKNLNQNLKDNTKVYFIINENSSEYISGVSFHLNLFYNKSPQIERLNPTLLPPLNNGDLIVVSREFQEIPDNIITQILSRKTLLYHTYLWTIYKIER